MSKNRRQAWRKSACGLAAILTVASSSMAIAQQDTRANAAASLEVVDAVGTGINIDLATEVLTGIFLGGRVGDAVSILVPGRRAKTGGRAIRGTSDVVILSASSYRLELGIGIGAAFPIAGIAPERLLYLAQFN